MIPPERSGARLVPPLLALTYISLATASAWGAAKSHTVNSTADIGTRAPRMDIARDLLGLMPVLPSFRANGPTIPPDAVIASRIDCLGPH